MIGPVFEKLVIATHNLGKLAEFKDLLQGVAGEVLSAAELDLPEPEETGNSFKENAALKAQAAAQASGLPALADDSGLCVEILDGQPGIFSARWGGPEKSAMVAMRRVHEEMTLAAQGQGEQNCRAYFIALLALAWPDGRMEFFEGRVEGEIVWPPRGTMGHGYDPIFRPAGAEQTFAEMRLDQKQALSHRGRAFAALLAWAGR